MESASTAERERLRQATAREQNWQRWGTYLPERQWGTVREDYTAAGDVWAAFPHEMARYRAYRWGEDGLLGWTDRECRLCFSTTLWNGRDPILKERLFGLTGTEGNHGEDVKELYYYLDALPTGAYAKALYKYPQAAFPYQDLIDENHRRGYHDSEYELIDTGIFAEERYFDVQVEYAKRNAEDMLARITVSNRGPEQATLAVLPTLTLRNNWSWRNPEPDQTRPSLERIPDAGQAVRATHKTLGQYRWQAVEGSGSPEAEALLLTENDTNIRKLDPGYTGDQGFSKDAFERYLIHNETGAINPEHNGTKAALLYRLELEPGASLVIRLRLVQEQAPEAKAEDLSPASEPLSLDDFEAVFRDRIAEADAFYAGIIPTNATEDERNVSRQAFAGLLWTKQFYYYVADRWLEGDPTQPAPPEEHRTGRNQDWRHLFCRDVLSMPDKWEYPWFAAWDTAFHMLPMAEIDGDYAKTQLLILLREWYLHPNGQMPAYEFNFSDVNPPVHAWSVVHVYQITAERSGKKDLDFLERCFQKLLMNFTWWVNRNDLSGKNIFGGGFLGLDNIGVFDRSQKLPDGARLSQADGTAWMAFFCSAMLTIALELAQTRPAYEDIASKFFEHYIAIIDALNTLGGQGLWNEEDGFYFDQLLTDGQPIQPLRVHSIVGIIPLYAITLLPKDVLEKLPGFRKRMDWFMRNKPNLARYVSAAETGEGDLVGSHFIGLVPKDRLVRILTRLLDESQFLSDHGIRALSKYHEEHPFEIELGGQHMSVKYLPAEGDSDLFGGNSNWRGPVWFPVNVLLLNALDRYHAVYGDAVKVECPAGSGSMLNLEQVTRELARRLVALFLRDETGRRPCHGDEARYQNDPYWRDLLLFNEYFCGDTGRGTGASHQTGWTALVATCLRKRYSPPSSGLLR